MVPRACQIKLVGYAPADVNEYQSYKLTSTITEQFWKKPIKTEAEN